jgi:hypothetical protein
LIYWHLPSVNAIGRPTFLARHVSPTSKASFFLFFISSSD